MTRLQKYLRDNKWNGEDGIDMYNFSYFTDVHPTLTTRTIPSNNYLIMERVNKTMIGWTRDSKGEIRTWHPVSESNCITANKRNNTQNYIVANEYRIRKITEKEAFRLTGVSDDNIEKIRNAVSKTSCYKLAGNSIVVDSLFYIFEQMFIGNQNSNQQLEIF
jgi:site-specific DNA-cytosine methylase